MPAPLRLPSADTFNSWYEDDDPSRHRRLCLTLPRTGTGVTALEALANDVRFKYWSALPPAAPPIKGFTRMKTGKELRPSIPSSHTQIGALARQKLRDFGFELVALGIPKQTPPSAHASSSQLGRSPIPSFDHPHMEFLFQQRARAVDRLLEALKRARGWNSQQLLQQCLEVTDHPEDIVKTLHFLFGQDLSADLIVDTNSVIGSTPMKIGESESFFNRSLDNSVIAAANAVLMLVGMAWDENEEDASQEPASIEDADKMAAGVLVRAVQRYLRGPILEFFDSGAGRVPVGLPSEAFICSRPDWVLISTTGDGVTVHGVVEHKPHTDRGHLLNFCMARDSPLGPSISCDKASTEETVSEPTEDTRPTKRQRLPRKAAPAPGMVMERPTTPEAERKQRRIADNPIQGPNFGCVDESPWQKIALQLSSQLLLHNVRNALLWADWGRALLPVQLWPASDALLPAVETFSDDHRAYVLSCAAVACSDPSGPSPPEESHSPAVEADTLSTLRFTHQTNVIMGLVKWAIHAEADQRARGRLLPSGGPSPLSQRLSSEEASGGDIGSDYQGPSDYASGSSHPGASNHDSSLENQGDRGEDASDDAQETTCSSGDGLVASDSGGSTAQSGSLQSFARSSSTSVTADGSDTNPSCARAVTNAPDDVRPGRQWVDVLFVPFACGRYAEVYRGNIKLHGQPVQSCVFKFNCPPGWRQSLPFESPDVDDDCDGGAIGRFEREREVLRALKSLQGTVVPRLLSTSRIVGKGMPNCPPSLVLEDVGKRIDEPDAWPPGISDKEKRRLVEDAYRRLHEADWVHGDAAPRNILVSYQQAQSTEASVRVCLVDFARARRRVKGYRPEDDYELETVLDDLFGPNEDE